MIEYQRSILKSNVNGIISLLFVGTFAVGAMLIVCQAAFGENPIANAMAKYVIADTQLSAQVGSQL